MAVTALSPVGSYRDWLVTLGGLALAAAIFLGRQPGAAPGALIPVVITVVADDVQNLDCAGSSSSFPFGNETCAFEREGQPLVNGHPLRPFVTVGSELVLLSGVFEEGHVNAWLREAVTRGSATRVTLSCRGRFLGISGEVSVRFLRTATWRQVRNVSAIQIQDCQVDGPTRL
jgi:hypothetical protein